MIENFKDLNVSIQYNYLQLLIERINQQLDINNIHIIGVIFHECLNEYSIMVSFGGYLKGHLLYSDTLETLYKHLDRWEGMNYLDLLIEIGKNIDLSKKCLKL